MDKQEFIERMKSLKNLFGNKSEYVEINAVIELASELDEPQKVQVPQFVADWIEYSKYTDVTLVRALLVEKVDLYNYANQKDSKELKEFLKVEGNQELFARAWLDGYEVEKESKYTVKFKATKQYLCDDEIGPHFDPSFRSNFTKSDLEKLDLGWVFDCEGIEVEKVGK